MGNPWRPQEGKADWFPVPRELVKGGYLRDLTGSALKLYSYVCFLAQKHTAIRLEISNSEIELFCGLHHESATAARRELVVKGLILTNREELEEGKSKGKLKPINGGEGGVCRYTLVDPFTHMPLCPQGFPEDGGLRKFWPAPGQSARSVRAARQIVIRRRVARGKSATGVSEVTQPSCRKTREGVSENPSPTPSQVIKNMEQKHSGTSLKNSEKKEVSEERSDEITSTLAESPVVRALAQKFGARIVGVLDLGTGAQSGDVGPAGIAWGEWDRKQRTFRYASPRGNGKSVMVDVVASTREKIVARHPELMQAIPHTRFVEPERYEPKTSLGQPERCPIHGRTDWWLCGDRLTCWRCHPQPGLAGTRINSTTGGDEW